MTTPLISTIVPTFVALDCSDMALPGLAGCGGCAPRATHKGRTKSPESSGRRAARSLPGSGGLALQRHRQPGGVVELSAARGDEVRQHPHSVRAAVLRGCYRPAEGPKWYARD